MRTGVEKLHRPVDKKQNPWLARGVAAAALLGIGGTAYERCAAPSEPDPTADTNPDTTNDSNDKKPIPRTTRDVATQALPLNLEPAKPSMINDLKKWQEIESEGTYTLPSRVDLINDLFSALSQDIKDNLVVRADKNTELAITLYNVNQDSLLLSVNESGKYILSTTSYNENRRVDVSHDVEMFDNVDEVVKFLHKLKTKLDQNQPSTGPNRATEASRAGGIMAEFIKNYSTSEEE
ncbi:MAG: hypothetical protein WCW27_01900 [Patescibacteria group bacterium]|jgi:hypothetical protein